AGSLGREGRWHVGAPDPSLTTLDPHRWSRPGIDWVTATPVALGRFPAGMGRKGTGRRESASAAILDAASEDIRRACGHVGLPEPLSVQVSLAPLLEGALPVRSYPPFTRGGVRRALVHAAISFAEPVRGPVVLGSGRYLGLGLFLPVGGQQ
ncbi:MAG: type I-G CRISPR-associated protein Csb2, partial [Acidimicrobiales bacterium]